MNDSRGAVRRGSVEGADDVADGEPRERASAVPDAAVDASGVHAARIHPVRLQAPVELLAEEDVGELGGLVPALPPVVQKLLGLRQVREPGGDAARRKWGQQREETQWMSSRGDNNMVGHRHEHRMLTC